LRWWITPNNPAVKKQAESLKNNDELGTIVKCYNWLEDGYHYEEDDTVLLNNGHVILTGGQDFWQLPIYGISTERTERGEYLC